MNILLWYSLCIILMFLCIKGTIRDTLDEESIEHAVKRLLYYFSVFVTFLLLVINLDTIYLGLLKFISANMEVTNLNKMVGLTCIFFIAQMIIYKIFCFFSNPFIKGYGIFFNKLKINMVLIASVFGFFKGLILLLIIILGVATLNSTLLVNRKLKILDGVSAYERLGHLVKTNKESITYEDLKEYIPSDSNIIIYYNGVTLEDGVKSSNDINIKAKELVSEGRSQREKAKQIYAWIGTNIEYDYDKAKEVLGNKDVKNSGAREAWTTRRGICFDYACLYVAMCREVGLKVRLITGKAFDGKEYVPHAWNEVYLEDEGKWINVDPTFYLAGNNFDNEDFNLEHSKEHIAGEW